MWRQNTGKTLTQFESLLRSSLLVEKMRSIVTDGVQVTPAEIQAQFRQRNTKAKIDYVVLDPSQFLKDVKVTPDALDAYLQERSREVQASRAAPSSLRRSSILTRCGRR